MYKGQSPGYKLTVCKYRALMLPLPVGTVVCQMYGPLGYFGCGCISSSHSDMQQPEISYSWRKCVLVKCYTCNSIMCHHLIGRPIRVVDYGQTWRAWRLPVVCFLQTPKGTSRGGRTSSINLGGLKRE